MKTKKLTLIAAAMMPVFFSLGQQTVTSVSNGNANNPLIWDCLCFPAPNDSVVIAHDVVMNTDWIVNGGGAIHVLNGASLIEDSQHRTVLFDGAGSNFDNAGTTELTNIAFYTDAYGNNEGTLSLDTGLYICATCSFNNTGLIQDLDSIVNLGDFHNWGSMTAGDFWNDGIFQNNGTMDVDSLLNTLAFTTLDGIITCYEFGNDSNFYIGNFATMYVINNFYNAGSMAIEPGRSLHIGNNFFNTDTINGYAYMSNDGLVEVFNDFYNTEEVIGTGNFCIGAYTANTGSFMGSFDFCDNTGGNIDLNTGSVAAGITFCATNYAVGIDEDKDDELVVFPNPASDMITIQGLEVMTAYTVTDMAGRKVLSGRTAQNVDIGTLNKGIYFLNVFVNHHVQSVGFVKE